MKIPPNVLRLILFYRLCYLSGDAVKHIDDNRSFLTDKPWTHQFFEIRAKWCELNMLLMGGMKLWSPRSGPYLICCNCKRCKHFIDGSSTENQITNC